LARELIVVIDDELEREMSKYPEVDWIDTIRKLLRLHTPQRNRQNIHGCSRKSDATREMRSDIVGK
jgi:hypothetical protein